MGSVERRVAPSRLGRGQPDPIPVVLLARLAQTAANKDRASALISYKTLWCPPSPVPATWLALDGLRERLGDTLGVLDSTYRIGGISTDETMRLAREILEHPGATWRSNKSAAMLVAADGPTIAKARSSARTLAGLRDLKADRHRLNRFNAEQREQFDKRLGAAEDRRLLLLGEADASGTRLDHIDLGPARVDARIGDRVLEYLRSTDHLVETTLTPAALLAARFGLLPDGTNAVELDALLRYFYRLPRLPKLVGPAVIRQTLVEGVGKGLFGLASGSSWDAEDVVLRFAQTIDPSEIQFHPGTWLVRAAAIKDLIAKRQSPTPPV